MPKAHQPKEATQSTQPKQQPVQRQQYKTYTRPGSNLGAIFQRVQQSDRVKEQNAWQQKANDFVAQRRADREAAHPPINPVQKQAAPAPTSDPQTPVQKQEAPKANNTGLPDNLKTGVENLSGYSMDDVKVHYNSAKPAQLQAHAYAQGTDIHLGPGQEKHLPHEAWHVVQQKQGRVKPILQMKGGVNVNDDAGLEREADAMGVRALQLKESSNSKKTDTQALTRSSSKIIQREPVGIGKGTDNDRANINVAELVQDERINAIGDWRNRADVESFTVKKEKYTSARLKHYMVVKKGTLYQFPIKSIIDPNGNDKIGYQSKVTGKVNDRGGQIEPFGGTTDLDYKARVVNGSLFKIRNETLKKEYSEENDQHKSYDLEIIKSKKFGYTYPTDLGTQAVAGTLSIATIKQEIAEADNWETALNRANVISEGFQPNNLEKSKNRGELEMAGTIVINCNKLINSNLTEDALEQNIGYLMQQKRDNFFAQNARKKDPNNKRKTEGIFNTKAGVLAHLVSMVKDDILAERDIKLAYKQRVGKNKDLDSPFDKTIPYSAKPSHGMELLDKKSRTGFLSEKGSEELGFLNPPPGYYERRKTSGMKRLRSGSSDRSNDMED